MSKGKIALTGAGIIGLSWAVVFARAGYDVAVHVRNPGQNGLFQDRLMGLLRSSRVLLTEPEDVVAARVSSSVDLAETCAGAMHVQESLPEVLSVKQAMFAMLDRLLPDDVTISSSTSGFPVSEIAAGLEGQRRCLVAHPATPPHLLPVVEIVPSLQTENACVERCIALMQTAGMKPVRLWKEQKGFVLNRLQVALIREMLAAIREGVVSPEGADGLIRDGFGLRWGLVGPLEGIDLNAPGGIADYLSRYASLYDDADGTSPLGAELVADLDRSLRQRHPLDQHPRRIAERDRKIAGLRVLREE